jgi:hypothetical protein
MNSAKSSVRSLAALAVAGILAGCAGGASTPQTSSNALPFAPSQMRVAGGAPIDPLACKIDHGVSLKPCSIHLSDSNFEQTVTAKGPKGGKFTYNDKTCTQEGIASISGSGKTYQAYWGTESGSCTAVFTDKTKAGKTIGTAKLSITNKA